MFSELDLQNSCCWGLHEQFLSRVPDSRAANVSHSAVVFVVFVVIVDDGTTALSIASRSWRWQALLLLAEAPHQYNPGSATYSTTTIWWWALKWTSGRSTFLSFTFKFSVCKLASSTMKTTRFAGEIPSYTVDMLQWRNLLDFELNNTGCLRKG